MRKRLDITIEDRTYKPYEVLILEDDENRISGFRNLFSKVGANIIWVSTAKECISALANDGPFDIIFLDHDLGGETFVDYNNANTGSEVARWIMENPIDKDTIVVIHSVNPAGSLYMNELIPNSHRIPFAWRSGIGNIGYKE